MPPRKTAGAATGKKRKRADGSAASGSSSAGRGTASKAKTKVKRGGRNEKSLGRLTQKFLKLLRSAPDGELDLNHTAQTLDVAKRRIYDITNVLEGIGLLEKKSKNTIRWQGATSESQESRVKEVDDLRAEVEQLQKLEMEIDSRAQECEQALATMADDPKDRLRSYVTNTDIVSIEGFRGKQLLAIKAPSGTSLEVPDPDEGMKKGKRRYQVYLRSTHGPIDIYMNVGAGKSEIARANSSNANITITRNAAGAAGAMGMSPTRGSSNSLLAPKGRRRAVVGSPAFSPALAAVNGVTMSPLNVGGNAPLDESFILLSPMSFSHGEDFSSVLDEQLEGVADFFQVSGNKVKAH